jgi:hypothetical protein
MNHLREKILEPACGSGNITKVLRSWGYSVEASDIRTTKGIKGLRGIDFLERSKPTSNIVTNPPYSLAEEFIEHGLTLVRRKMVLLLRLSFLESERRYNLLRSTPLEWVYIFSKRLPYWDGKKFNNTGGQFCHAWFVWNMNTAWNCPRIQWLTF